MHPLKAQLVEQGTVYFGFYKNPQVAASILTQRCCTYLFLSTWSYFKVVSFKLEPESNWIQSACLQSFASSPQGEKVG